MDNPAGMDPFSPIQPPLHPEGSPAGVNESTASALLPFDSFISAI